MALHVPAHAEDLLETAVELATDANRPSVLGEAADAARAAGHLERAIALLRERAALEQEAGDRMNAARTLARLASVLLVAQANEPALRELEAALGGIRRWQSDPAGIELAAQLARAHSVLGDDREALRWADRALPAARRLDLRAVGTELRITRATAQLSLGDDPESGLEELRGAIAEAQEGELLRAELRARNNLAWGLLADDPLAAGDTARQGLGLATEMGIGDFLVPLADLACSAALEAGSWDWALATAEAEDGGSGGTYRVVLTAVSAVIRALRGERAAFAALDALEPLPPDTDTQLLAVCGLARAWQHFLAGDLDGARDRADRAIVDAPNLPLHELAVAVRIRLWQGDRDAAAATLAVLADPSRWGRAADGARRTMEAGIAALEGDPRAGGLYRDAVEGWERLSLPLQRTLCLLDRQRLLPEASDEHELREAIAALGANGLADLAAPAARKRRTQKAGARPGAGAAQR